MKFIIGSLGVALAALLVQATLAGAHGGGDCGCDKCGCETCDISCRLVCETKKVPKVSYCCKCEPFCAAHPCPFNQVHECEEPKCECDGCSNECCAELWLKNLFHCDDAHAACADDFHKKKLIKFVAQKEVKVYKWVAEKTCPRCGCCSECACGAAQSAPAPYAPMPGAPVPGGPLGMPPAPAPVPGKSVFSPPAVNVPAAYHISDDNGATLRDPIFQAFSNK